MKPVKHILISIAILLSAGCGTLATRTNNDHSFGFPPYAAVSSDVTEANWISGQADWSVSTLAWTCYGITLPFDFVIDTLLLPADLVTGLCGHDKWSK